MGDVAGPSVRCFSEATPDATLHFQVIDLGRQLYVWVGTQPTLGNLFFAIKSPAATLPSVATLLPSDAASEAPTFAQRLALKAGKPVLCSCNLPGGTPLLQAVAERRLMRELADMGLTAGAAAAGGGAAAAPAAAAAAPGGERSPAPATPELSERVAGLQLRS